MRAAHILKFIFPTQLHTIMRSSNHNPKYPCLTSSICISNPSLPRREKLSRLSNHEINILSLDVRTNYEMGILRRATRLPETGLSGSWSLIGHSFLGLGLDMLFTE